MTPPHVFSFTGPPNRIDSQYIACVHKNVTVDSDICPQKNKAGKPSVEEVVI